MDRNKIEINSYFAADQIINHKSKFGRLICGYWRSEYERRFAKALEIMGRSYAYEKYAFKLKNENGVYIHYIPDFYIEGTTLFIEIQHGSPTRKRKHQILMFQEQYPSLNLLLLNGSDIRKYLRCEIDIDFDKYSIKEQEMPHGIK